MSLLNYLSTFSYPPLLLELGDMWHIDHLSEDLEKLNFFLRENPNMPVPSLKLVVVCGL